MAEFKPAKGFEQLAARLVVADVNRVAKDLRDSAKEKAPPSKEWRSLQDARVRQTHKQAHGQEVPENVRYRVPSPPLDHDSNAFQLMRYPRDEENSTIGNYAECRCFEEFDPEGVRRNIDASQAVQKGSKVTAHVTAKFNRIEESEYGAHGEAGLRFMGRALQEIASKHRGR